jgi:DNA polymerase-3 subunit alpha
VRLAGERETLGLYLTGHPIAEYERELKPIVSGRIADVGGARPVGAGEGGNVWRGPGRNVTVAGLVLEIRKRGGRTSFILDDRSGRMEVAMFDDVYQQFRPLVTRDAILVIEGALRWDDFIDDWRLQARKILDVDQAREQYARNLVLRWPADPKQRNGDAGKLVARIEQALRPSQGGRCAVAVRYSTGDAAAILQFGEQWKVRPSRELIERLGNLVGREGVELYYAPRDT